MSIKKVTSVYKIIPAEEKHLEQLIPCFTSTGYDLATAKYNLLGVDTHSYVRDYKIKVALPITHIIVDNNIYDKVLGMITCGSAEQIIQYKGNYYQHPEIAQILEPLFNAKISNSYHISRIGILNTMRRCGLGKKLMYYAEQEAKRCGYSKLSLFVWNCQPGAIKFYLACGMMITRSIFVSDKLPYPVLLYLEKDLTVPRTFQNYFETEEYNCLEACHYLVCNLMTKIIQNM